MFLKTSGIICMHFISWKLVVSCFSAKISSFSKLQFLFSSFRSIEPDSRLIEKVEFLGQLTAAFNSCSVSWNLYNYSFDRYSIPLDQLKFENFKFLRLDRSVLSYSLFLFDSSQFLLRKPFFFFFFFWCLFWVKSLRGFLL